jgi:transposase
MQRQAYKTDLSDAEWEVLGSHIPAPLAGRRPAKWRRREIVNAIVYVLRAGCQWHLLPHGFPAYKTVYDYYRQWRRNGLWEGINTALREQLRIAVGRDAQPSAAIIDSQSIKTTEKGANVASTMASRSRVVNGISWWIPKGSCSNCGCGQHGQCELVRF